MWDDPLLSDEGVESLDLTGLEARSDLLSDLEDAFHEHMWMAGFYGILIPIVSLLGLILDWFKAESQLWVLVGAAIVAIASLAIWAHSFFWHGRFKRRNKILMRLIRPYYGGD